MMQRERVVKSCEFEDERPVKPRAPVTKEARRVKISKVVLGSAKSHPRHT